MKIPTVILAISTAFVLSGCFFFYIPGSAISAIGDTLTGSFGNACIKTYANVGDKVKMPNGMATITRISGSSSRCQDPSLPMRAEVTYD